MRGAGLDQPQAAGQKAKIFFPASSFVFLPEAGPLRRLPRAPKRQRPQKFWDGFEDRALIYDVFWDNDGRRILMVCPPPMNLETHWRTAVFRALPSGERVFPHFFFSRSTMLVAFDKAPSTTTHIAMSFASADYELFVQDSMVDLFAGARILFTMNKNNDLSWVVEWARYHALMHGTDAVVLFDNGSTRYSLVELKLALGTIPKISKIALFSWPYRFGQRDPGVWGHPYWSHFLQISSMTQVLRRLGMKANGILNCDIDELAAPIGSATVYDLATNSKYGVAGLAGCWVENIKSTTEKPMISHCDFEWVRHDPSRFLCPKKWVLDPARDWVKSLETFPYWHRIINAPERHQTDRSVGHFWHFKGINTNWKSQRRQTKKRTHFGHQKPAALQEAFARYAEAVKDQTDT